MKINLLTPMTAEKEKLEEALHSFGSLRHSYEVTKSGIGRENTAKAMLNKPKSDLCVLVGFAAIVGQERTLPAELRKGELAEVTASSLFGYRGEIFENGKLRLAQPKTQLPHLPSLTSDKFITATDIPVGTLISMEDYTFMCLKREQDFILRVISDFLPHREEIDFFEEIKSIRFNKVMEVLEKIQQFS
ncbi:MAG: hypothetical protein LBT29_03600 [Flavobacteriaceae bacterium]|jgi:hypothetical protein|nr:hypothetical protein [Flavobacteriaceae bacterium]